MRKSTLTTICLGVALVLSLSVRSGSAQYGTFDFNDGTVQGWWLDGAYDENGNGPFSSYFTFSWWDMVNYPNTPFNDPAGDNNGIVARKFQPGAPAAAEIGVGEVLRLHARGLATDLPTGAAQPGKTGQGAGDEYQAVLRVESPGVRGYGIPVEPGG